ncbi:N-acetyltransferase [Flavobacteriaceae bacterium S0825]|uniref:N-acetyltransferase n=1 Tax=Gaetbulibacter sp. S0825 TaxID=2720084 RepID=UPI001AD7EEFB|nr:N-acetyltransferase [Gaetbulibacter sp. S0825]MCK0109525.1 N-acetyltransferase [Flavobacteriaceae bacterium S0825]
MNFIKTDDYSTIKAFRKGLYKTLVAPLDSMWQDLYIASSQTYLIEKDNKHIGYCCIDNDAALLQVFVINEYRYLMQTVIRNLIDLKLITSASLSSIEPLSFNACLFHSVSMKTNTFCYEYSNRSLEDENSLKVELVTPELSNTIRSYYKEHVGFDDTFGYVDNLVSRKELFIALENDTIIATGECRLSDTQLSFADVGVSVNTEHRKKAWQQKCYNKWLIKQLSKIETLYALQPLTILTLKKLLKEQGFIALILFLILIYFRK